MGHGYSSIETLIQKTQQTTAPASPSTSVSIDDESVEGRLQKKMATVALKEKEIEIQRLAQQIRVPYIDLRKFPISHEALRQVPVEQAKELQALCFFITQDEIRVAAIDPQNQKVKELAYQLAERHGANSAIYIISPASFAHAFELYRTIPTIKPISKDVTVREDMLEQVQASVANFESLQQLFDKASTSDLLTFLMGGAFKLGSSDVHVEAEENEIVVRFRMDGILHDVATIAKEKYKQLVSRIKLLASIKINITDKPQDGRFTIKLSKGDVDVRVSTIPTVYGESIVMRLLRQNRSGLSFEELGISGKAFQKLKAEIERPNGMIITTGPTGSGKTTTLYSIMQKLNAPEVKIITLEDPVEYKMEGINQSQMDPTKGYTFAQALRSILRQDPDIAMVGEIRDLETAEIAIQAALTGHLILSTIHTNNAAASIPRFLSMGVKPFLLAPALNAVIGQRLVRKLCDTCKKEATLTSEQIEKITAELSALPDEEKAEIAQKPKIFYGPVGCDACNNLGYKGRIGIYEIFSMVPEIEKMILAGQVSEYDIADIAKKNGMITMVQDGLIKALEGVTSVQEVLRVIE